MSRVAVITNVTWYAGPGSLAALRDLDVQIVCHDPSFDDEAARIRFGQDHPYCTPMAAMTPSQLVSTVLDRFGRIDILVSNDCADTRTGPIEGCSAEIYRELLDRLAVAPFELIVAAVPSLKLVDQGRIILITSGAPEMNPIHKAAYTSARSATNGFVRSLARELGPDGISVNAIAPIYLDSHYTPVGMNDPTLAAAVRQHVPLGRLGSQQEIGALVRLLASDDGAFISGQIIAFSGAAS